MRRVRQSVFRLVRGICVLLMFAVPVAAFIEWSGIVGASRAGAAEAWHPTRPPIILATRWDAGWALSGHKPSAEQIESLVVSDALTLIRPPTPTPMPAVLTSMPRAGWTLDSGATITTDSHGVLVLRPLTSGRGSLPGKGKGWRGAYWLPLDTMHWQNYTLHVTITNFGSESSGGSATVVIGHSPMHVGFAVSISAARITIRDQNGRDIFSGVIPAATFHRVGVRLAKLLKVTVDGVSIAAFKVGTVHGGIGFGVYKPTAASNLPFFTDLWVRPN